MMPDPATHSDSPAYSPRDAAMAIVQTLQDNGHVAYFAGGCVRDALLGLTPKDYDVATSALPKQVASLFRHTQFVGEAFGVTLVRMKKHSVEVATFRKEWGYEDGRRPTKVVFSDAQNDAHRRDFTINGLFENPLATSPDQTIIDHVHGQADLRAGILRAIGNADERFAEDYLRMLRAVRFASRFDFRIDEMTSRAIMVHARYLGQISRERIGQEIQAVLTPTHHAHANHAAIIHAAKLIQSLHLDGPTLNESHLDAPLPALTRLAMQTASDTLQAVDYPAMLAAWMLDRHHATESQVDRVPSVSYLQWLKAWLDHHAADTLQRWRRALMLSNATSDAMTGSMMLLGEVHCWSDMSVAKQKRLLANIHWPRTHALLGALSHQQDVHALASRIDADAPGLVASGLTPPILLSGEDLIKLRQKPGPAFRRLLDQAYDLQLEGRLTSKAQALAWLKEHLGIQDD